MKYLFIILLLLFIGCEESRVVIHKGEGEGKACNGCEKLLSPQSWMATYVFKDFEGKEHKFSTEIKPDRYGPDSVYQTMGTQPDGKVRYYYSQEEPKKESTGLLYLTEMNGAHVRVDFTSVEIRFIPCTPLPLDEVAAERKKYSEEYQKKCDECPRHHEGYWRGRERRWR